MFRKLALAFIAIPLVEVILLIALTKVISFPATLAIVIITGIAGAALTKSQGLRALLAFKSGATSPQAAATDGMLILIAGVLLITPGVLTDFLGFALLTPGIRNQLRVKVGETAKAKMGFGFPGAATGQKVEKDPAPQSKAKRPTVIDV